ncbi:hypothetical protein ABLG29_005440 [Klebsiella variicola]
MEMEATGAPQKHHHTLNQQVGSITHRRVFFRVGYCDTNHTKFGLKQFIGLKCLPEGIS